MRIFAIMLVKDEADIVKDVLVDATKWADRIFVLDNGSTDGTWDIVQSLKSPIIVPWKQDFRPYTNGMRADVFNAFKDEAEPGDWWCFKLDADEFYVDDPKSFLSTIPSKYQLVAKKSLDYFITPEDLETHTFTGNFEEDRPFITYYEKNCFTEPRFFRYRKGLTWTYEAESHYPKHAGVLAPQTILVRHYQYRSPAQMQKRLNVRNHLATKQQGLAFRHVKETDWHQLVWNRDRLVKDDGNIATYRALPCRNSLTQPWYKNLCMEIGVKMGWYK